MKASDIEAKLKAIDEKMGQITGLSQRYTWLRLIVFIALVMSIYYGYQKNYWFYVLASISLLAFLILIIKHHHIKEELQYLNSLQESYDDILKRKDDEWKNFEDDGYEYLKEDDYLSYDLDLLGKNSLYQYLSIAKTLKGKQALANYLKTIEINPEVIRQRQMIVEECSSKEGFVMDYIAYLKQYRKRKKHRDNHVDAKDYPVVIYFGIAILSILSMISLIGMLLHLISDRYFMICYMLLLILSILGYMKHSLLFQHGSTLYDEIVLYKKLLDVIIQVEFKHEILVKKQKECQKIAFAFKQLNQIMNLMRIRNNAIFMLILNGICGFDFWCYHLYLKWLNKYQCDMEKLSDDIAYFEVVLSMVSFNYAKDNTCLPLISDEACLIDVEGIVHPLFKEDKGIPNDFHSKNQVIILSGSNMSGKTTFMRTLAMNLRLFQCGSRICANRANLSCMDMETSMRVHDNLSEGISTFYAEILRIKVMVEKSKQNQPLCVFIDEILKGTNVRDRINCSKKVIELLNQKHIIAIISTHDYELCELGKVINYHFDQSFVNGKIVFDYRLKQGKNKESNAKALMELVGII